MKLSVWHRASIILTLVSSVSFAAVPRKLPAFPEGERLVYTKLVEAYRKNNIREVYRQRQLLEKNYSASVHLDNAYYLTGVLEAQNQRFAEAIKSFQTIRTKFPKSNKRPGALFAIGSSYQKLKLPKLAVQVWKSVLNEYPGSPEAERAKLQLALVGAKVQK